MLRDVWTAMKTNNEKLAREVAERDDKVDMLDAEVTRFLIRLAAEEAGDFEPDEQMKQLRYSAELETIGDIIDKNLCDLVLKKIRLRAEFSKEGAEELEDFYQKVSENVVIAETLFTIRDRDLAQQLIRHKERIDQYERDLRDRHFARLNAGLTEAHETSAMHLDLLTHLKRINSCVTHAAYAILQDSHRPSPPIETGAGE
jgi:phosphate:Na+ symporter